MINAEDYIQYIKCLNEWTKAYDEGHPMVSDKQWDDLYFEVVEYEKNYPEYILEESPTQKISYQVVSELKKAKHNHPMLSLNKTKNIEEVKSFIGDKDYIVMAKMDGLTCSLHYEGGKLVSAETRGNGEVGEDITHNAVVIPSIPKRIRYKESFTVDGEIICTYANFHNWCHDYKNPRNFAAGSIRLLDSKECKERDLTFVAWDIIDSNFVSLSNKLNYLDYIGFTVVPYVCNDELEPLMDMIKYKAEIMSYPIDGIVIKYNQVTDYIAAGRTDHHFKGGLAYKFYDETYDTKLKWIEWSMGRTGVLTPVAIFEPIDIDGSTVERASLHNVSVMRETLGDCAYIGEPLKVFKANMIIPQIAEAGPKFTWDEVVKHNGASANDNPEFCPICQAATAIQTSADGVENLICTNPQCEGKLINKLDHFVGKKGLDIKGLSEKTLEKLIDWEWINDITDIPKLKEHRAEWISKPGFGQASVDKILKAIDDRLAEAPLHAFISGLGIPLIGSRVSKQICEKVETWKEFRDLIHEDFDFTEWNGFGYEMNRALHEFDYTEADSIVDYITFKPEEHQDKSVKLDSCTFVITGKLQNFKNRQELVDVIETNGGKVASSVSSKTNYLINNDVNSTSSKNKKAKELNIPIITEEELMEMLK
jgi:DNA ligase (NAD+)